MKIKTVEDLEDKLTEELAWRKKELLYLKRIIKTSKGNQNTYIRTGTAMLSAHYEGFIKVSANYYVNFVSQQKVSYDKIKNCFVSLKLKSKFKDCIGTEKISVYSRVFDKFDEISEQTFGINDMKIISTESNPSSYVLKEILTSIGLDYSPFESKQNFIDYHLLSKRHEVVHGDRTFLTDQDFYDTFKEIMEVIDTFKLLIIDAADNKKYLK